MVLNTANKLGPNQGWTSSGAAPSRLAAFPAATGIAGSVQEGVSPDGKDFCTRADLGL